MERIWVFDDGLYEGVEYHSHFGLLYCSDDSKEHCGYTIVANATLCRNSCTKPVPRGVTLHGRVFISNLSTHCSVFTSRFAASSQGQEFHE